MPYIFCDSCIVGCYSNFPVCPRCGGKARRVARRFRRRDAPASAAPGAEPREDVEVEVRAALYGDRGPNVIRGREG
jgi:hypothetical protein